jgi:hypothetical protein
MAAISIIVIDFCDAGKNEVDFFGRVLLDNGKKTPTLWSMSFYI